MPCSAKFSMILQTEILLTETSDFLKQKKFSRQLISCSIRVAIIRENYSFRQLRSVPAMQIQSDPAI